jgi:hypothetical protein
MISFKTEEKKSKKDEIKTAPTLKNINIQNRVTKVNQKD